MRHFDCNMGIGFFTDKDITDLSSLDTEYHRSNVPKTTKCCHWKGFIFWIGILTLLNLSLYFGKELNPSVRGKLDVNLCPVSHLHQWQNCRQKLRICCWKGSNVKPTWSHQLPEFRQETTDLFFRSSEEISSTLLTWRSMCPKWCLTPKSCWWTASKRALAKVSYWLSFASEYMWKKGVLAPHLLHRQNLLCSRQCCMPCLSWNLSLLYWGWLVLALGLGIGIGLRLALGLGLGLDYLKIWIRIRVCWVRVITLSLWLLRGDILLPLRTLCKMWREVEKETSVIIQSASTRSIDSKWLTSGPPRWLLWQIHGCHYSDYSVGVFWGFTLRIRNWQPSCTQHHAAHWRLHCFEGGRQQYEGKSRVGGYSKSKPAIISPSKQWRGKCGSTAAVGASNEF